VHNDILEPCFKRPQYSLKIANRQSVHLSETECQGALMSDSGCKLLKMHTI